MTKIPAAKSLLAGFVLLLGSVTQAHAQGKYAPGDMLDSRLAPKHDDVVLTIPTPEELKSCSVVNVQGGAPGSGGFMLLDANKKPLRRFYDSKGGGKVDVWSYFKDGVEVYREFDTTYKGSPNNFRWLNAGGMKWGVGAVDPKTGKAAIEVWRMISAEEVGQEAFQAVARQDYARLKALMIADNEMQMIKLPAAQIKRIADVQQQAQKKFVELGKTVNLAGTRFDAIESAVPNCDTAGDVETIKYSSRAIRYEITKDLRKWLHTGEMIQVGMAWRLVDVPTDKDPTGDPRPDKQLGNPELDRLLTLLSDHDKIQPKGATNVGGGNLEIDAYYRKRVQLVQQIIALDKANKSEDWDKQRFDNLTALAQNNADDASIALLKRLADDVVAKSPGSNLAAYGVYREAWTRYAVGMFKAGIDQKKIIACQDKWLEDLADFVKRYTAAEETPDGLHQLAIGCEFGGKTEEAKRWYTQLVQSFPQHNLASRARGSLARLNLIGNPMTLTAPRLEGGPTFDIRELKGKVVIVHYWGSYSDQYKDDFARLRQKMEEIGTKQNVELVSINLDDDAAKARGAAVAVTRRRAFICIRRRPTTTAAA